MGKRLTDQLLDLGDGQSNLVHVGRQAGEESGQPDISKGSPPLHAGCLHFASVGSGNGYGNRGMGRVFSESSDA